MSYIIGFFAILLKFIAFFCAFLLPAYILEMLLKALHLRVVGALPFIGFLGLVFYVSDMESVTALVLCVVLTLAWIACIRQVRTIPKQYFQMDSVTTAADLSWASVYAVGFGSLVVTIPAVEAALPWSIDGFAWYIYVCIAMFAVMPVISISGTLEDINKLKKILRGRKTINEDVFYELIDVLLKENDTEDDAKKKAAFIEEYLNFCGVKVIPSSEVEEEAADKADKPQRLAPALEEKPDSIEPIDINAADEQAFSTLPHFGLALAKKAVQLRTQLGVYRSIDDFYMQMNLQPHIIISIEPYLQCEAEEITHENRGRRIEF